MNVICYVSSTRRRRASALRVLILILLIAICYNVFFAWFITSRCMEGAEDVRLHFTSVKISCPRPISTNTINNTPLRMNEDASQRPLSHISHDTRLQDNINAQNAHEDLQMPPSAPPDTPEGQSNNGPMSPKGVKDSLHDVMSLLPDELHTRYLVKPIGGTGEKKLREVGLRARAFKKFFEAWEHLHLVSGVETVHIRDHMVHYLRDHPEILDSMKMSFSDVVHSYDTYRFFLGRLSTLLFPWIAPFFADHITLHAQIYGGGRGIVFSAGDEQAPYAITSIKAIRRLGCDLPIEVMYIGDDDLSEDYRADLERLTGVTTRDLSQMVNDEGWELAGWAAKPFAILLSSFREVIYIDADSLFFRNPETLFQEPAYQRTGALFFKDRIIMPEEKKHWLQQILPKPISKQVRQSRLWTGESGHMQESGVVVVDKWKHFVALLMVARMNGPDRDGDEAEGKVGVYDMVYGDKETFWLAWELVGDEEYAFHDGDAAVMGVLQAESSHNVPGQDIEINGNVTAQGEPLNRNSERHDPVSENIQRNFTICAPQLLHLDVHDRPIWFNGWLLPNKFSKEQQKPRFEAYIKEQREKPAAWQLEEHNSCCLTSELVFEFNQSEKDVLEMTINIATEVGALGGVHLLTK